MLRHLFGWKRIMLLDSALKEKEGEEENKKTPAFKSTIGPWIGVIVAFAIFDMILCGLLIYNFFFFHPGS